MRQALNKVRIEGILSENNLQERTYTDKATGKDKTCLSGDIKVRVEKDGQIYEIPCYVFQNELKKDGNKNPNFESWKKVMTDYTSIAAADSVEVADKVRISGDLTENAYKNIQTGSVVSYPRVRASFINRVTGEFKPDATFDAEIYVNNIAPVTDKDGVEVDPPKYCVDAVMVQYGGRCDVLKFHAASEGVINAITTNWEQGSSYVAHGRLNFTSTVETIKEEQDFGDPIERTRTLNVSELIITGGSQEPLDEDSSWTIDDIKKGITERKARVEADKKTPTETAPASGKKGGIDLGF